MRSEDVRSEALMRGWDVWIEPWSEGGYVVMRTYRGRLYTASNYGPVWVTWDLATRAARSALEGMYR